jgi:beta-lactamase regulating signal transducer with metallopeptidase domain
LGVARLRWLTRRAKPFDLECTRTGRQVRVVETDAAGVPMTWGFIRPVLLLPRGAGQWPAGRLRLVLLHELAHIERHDWLAQVLAEAACALYWFHPLVWGAARRLRIESERACDDRVLAAGVAPAEYARQLLEIARAT